MTPQKQEREEELTEAQGEKNCKHLKKNLREEKALAFIHTCIMPNCPIAQWTVDSGSALHPPGAPRRLGARTCWIGSTGVLEQPGVGDRVLGVVGSRRSGSLTEGREEEEEEGRDRCGFFFPAFARSVCEQTNSYSAPKPPPGKLRPPRSTINPPVPFHPVKSCPANQSSQSIFTLHPSPPPPSQPVHPSSSTLLSAPLLPFHNFISLPVSLFNRCLFSSSLLAHLAHSPPPHHPPTSAGGERRYRTSRYRTTTLN